MRTSRTRRAAACAGQAAMAGAGTSAIRSAAESFSMARVKCSRLQTHHRRGAENAELRRVDSHTWALLGEPRRSPRLIENKTLALRDHPHPNPLPHAGEGAMPDPSPAGEEGVLRGALSRLRERAGGEAGLSSRMRRARAAVWACKPRRALQVRVAEVSQLCTQAHCQSTLNPLCEPLRSQRLRGA